MKLSVNFYCLNYKYNKKIWWISILSIKIKDNNKCPSKNGAFRCGKIFNPLIVAPYTSTGKFPVNVWGATSKGLVSKVMISLIIFQLRVREIFTVRPIKVLHYVFINILRIFFNIT